MYTIEAVQDIYTRANRSFTGLIAHCAALPASVSDQALTGFAYPTLREQIHHVIGAERYWIGVLNGVIVIDDDLDQWPDMAAIQNLHRDVSAATQAYISIHTVDHLNTPQPLTMYGGATRDIKPVNVLIRLATHIFDHKGQLAAMCRTMGHPIPAGFDYPLL